MFATSRFHRLDFADTRATVSDSVLSLAPFNPAELTEHLAQADAADLTLLRLVGCAAVATLVIALASSLAL